VERWTWGAAATRAALQAYEGKRRQKLLEMPREVQRTHGEVCELCGPAGSSPWTAKVKPLGIMTDSDMREGGRHLSFCVHRTSRPAGGVSLDRNHTTRDAVHPKTSLAVRLARGHQRSVTCSCYLLLYQDVYNPPMAFVAA
jgi:hypothetical protein